MRIFGYPAASDWTDPFPKRTGIMLRLVGGDVCHPRGDGKWFEPPYFAKVWRFFVPVACLPYFAWRIGRRAGYIGAKVYGADSEAYLNWMRPEDVYEGSRAIHFSARPWATL